MTREQFAADATGARETVRAVARADPPGVELHDDIHGHTESLLTPERVSLDECGDDGFCFPVDRAYRVSYPSDCAPAVSVPQLTNVIVRDEDAQQVAEAVNREPTRVPDGTWTVEFASFGIKTFLAVDGPIHTDVDDERRRLFFPGSASSVRVGLRSLHERPAATVRAGPSPRALMRAVSCLGSALKTRSPERSFPTLRGHPPLIDVDPDAPDDWFEAPRGLERTPDGADVVIRVPERLDAVYAVASLAYYLDAPVVPGDPALLAGARVIPLTGEGAPGEDLAASAARVLERTFTLDCVTRTEGFYRVRVGERERLDAALAEGGETVDWGALYDAPLGERIARYLALPADAVSSVVPRWPVTAHVEPAPERAAFLPFVADALGTVRPVADDAPAAASESPTAAQEAAVADFLRDRSDGAAGVDGSQPVEEYTADGERVVPSNERTVTVPETDAITDLWCASGHPVGGVEPTVDACRRRLEAQPSGTIDVAVVSNSPAMREESNVQELYGLRELLAFDVTMYEELSADALRGVLSDDHDLVHFVGHVSGKGLQTADGWLDARDLPPGSVGARAFVLNACRSYAQGRALVDAGAIGGLCTVSPVGNAPATDVGRTVARLLNAGFTLGGALDIVRDASVTGRQYSVVGDPRIVVAEGRGATPIRAHVDRLDDDRFRVTIHGYPSALMDVGTLYMPHLGENDVQHLNSGRIGSLVVDADELMKYLALERFPVSIAGDRALRWSDSVQLSEFR